MIALNLEAKTPEQKILKDYLESNVSDILAEKINNGTPFEKDGKQLINKKTLDGFLAYACEEARKQAEKGARSACIEDKTVFGWAIHYFEEDSVEGTLYDEEGTKYEPEKGNHKTPSSVPFAPHTAPAPKPKPQISLFDVLETQPETDEPAQEPDEDEDFPTKEELAELLEEEKITTPIPEEEIDIETGEVLNMAETSSILVDKLSELFGDTFILR